MSNEELLKLLQTKPTVSVAQAGKILMNYGKNKSYEEAKSGSIAGVEVLKDGREGPRARMRVASARILKRLGLEGV